MSRAALCINNGGLRWLKVSILFISTQSLYHHNVKTSNFIRLTALFRSIIMDINLNCIVTTGFLTTYLSNGHAVDLLIDIHARLFKNGPKPSLYLRKSERHDSTNGSCRREADMPRLRLRIHDASNAHERRRQCRGRQKGCVAVLEL